MAAHNGFFVKLMETPGFGWMAGLRRPRGPNSLGPRRIAAPNAFSNREMTGCCKIATVLRGGISRAGTGCWVTARAFGATIERFRKGMGGDAHFSFVKPESGRE